MLTAQFICAVSSASNDNSGCYPWTALWATACVEQARLLTTASMLYEGRPLYEKEGAQLATPRRITAAVIVGGVVDHTVGQDSSQQLVCCTKAAPLYEKEEAVLLQGHPLYYL